jgi:hypothetical protein
MPKVITPLNLDFDEKEEFVRRFGKGELSDFCRKAIHRRLEAEKNEEALTQRESCRQPVKIPHYNKRTLDVFNISNWIQTSLDYFRRTDDLKQIDLIKPQAQELFVLLNGKQMGIRKFKR